MHGRARPTVPCTHVGAALAVQHALTADLALRAGDARSAAVGRTVRVALTVSTAGATLATCRQGGTTAREARLSRDSLPPDASARATPGFESQQWPLPATVNPRDLEDTRRLSYRTSTSRRRWPFTVAGTHYIHWMCNRIRGPRMERPTPRADAATAYQLRLQSARRTDRAGPGIPGGSATSS